MPLRRRLTHRTHSDYEMQTVLRVQQISHRMKDLLGNLSSMPSFLITIYSDIG